MSIRSGIMRLNARRYSVSCKSRTYCIGRFMSSAPRAMAHKNSGYLRYLPNSLLSTGIASERSCTRFDLKSNTSYQLRLYSSESGAHNAGGDKVNKTEEESNNEPQQEKPTAESTTKITPRLSKRGTRFKNEFLSKIVPWEKIPVSFDNFPYYIEDHTKALLMECVASHVKQHKFRKYGRVLTCSRNRIQLQSIPGTDLYRDSLVSAVARELQVPLLKLDSSILPPYDIGQHNSTTLESKEDSSDSDYSDEDDSDYSDEDESSDGEDDNSAMPDSVRQLQKGDRVKYVGDITSIEGVKHRTLSKGDRGEVHEVNGDKVAVIFNACGLKRKEAEEKEEEEEKEKNTETTAQILTWLDAKNVKHEDNAHLHDCYIAMELLYEVLESGQPIVVYFPDSFFSNISEASWSDRRSFLHKAKTMLDYLSGQVVLILGKNKSQVGSTEIEKFPDTLKKYIKKLQDTEISEYHADELFTNVMSIQLPKDEELDSFIKQIEQDRTTVISQGNLRLMHQVLKAHEIVCMDLEQANTTDTILKQKDVEKIVSWATNHHLSSCSHPCVKNDLLHIPHESLKLGITRLEAQKNPSAAKKDSYRQRIKDVAEGSHERQLVSAVVCPEEIGVKFDIVGALEHVKKTLYETVILPMRRPELFSHGNLMKPCKGVLLFGPPGTGKTLMAKALATESGANLINVTSASITSKWVGETERLTRALFSYARKLAPVIIFVDEVDSLLGARGHNKYNDDRLNEFMAAWDGLNTKDSERILVMGATNRPFALDDAVLRRMPRRIYVGLPDAENRCKILKILLSKEKLVKDFCINQLAEATQGYSGDDLKNLCVAAAYRPVQELLQRESELQGDEKSDGEAPTLRPLNIDDFILSKSKVRASVSSHASSIQKLQEWDKIYGEGESSTCF